MTRPEYRIRVTELGEYVLLQSCQRRFKLGYDHRKHAMQLPFFRRLESHMDPILAAHGREREDEWEVSLLRQGSFKDLSSDPVTKQERRETTWADFVARLSKLKPGEAAFARVKTPI